MLKRRQFRERRKFVFNKKYFLVGLILILLVVFFLFALRYSTVKKINFQLNNLFCTDQLSIEKEITVLNKNIFFINEFEIGQKLRKKFPCIGDIKLEKNYPQNIEISIDSRKAAIILNNLKLASESGEINLDEVQIASGSGFLSIPDNEFTNSEKLIADNEGVIFSNDPSKYQVMQADYIGKKLKVGDLAGENIINAVNILEKLHQLGFDVTRSLILEDRVLIAQSSEKLIFSLRKDKNIQLASLQLILQKAKMDSKEISTIDLRFDKPTIVYSPKKNWQ